jgi:hypothetical protein
MCGWKRSVDLKSALADMLDREDDLDARPPDPPWPTHHPPGKLY